MKQNIKFIVSIIEAIYIIYFLNYFKTKINLDFGFILEIVNRLSKLLGINADIFSHPTYQSDIPICYVCPLGNFAGWFFGLFFILRNYFPSLYKINKYLIILLFLGSFMNLNVLIYLIPIFIVEIFLEFY